MGVGQTHPAPRVRTLRTPHPFEEPPALYGDSVAWAESVPGKNSDRLLLSTTQRIAPRVAATSPSDMYIAGVGLSADWVVWAELQGRGGPAWSAWAQSRRTGRNIELDSSAREGPAPDPLYETYLSLSGDTVALAVSVCRRECRLGTVSFVELVHLPSGRRVKVASVGSDCDLTWPSLSAALLVWSQEGRCHGSLGTNIVLYSLVTHRVSLLTRDGRSSEPSVDGRSVAWKRAPGRLGDGAIVLMDLQTGQQRVLDTHNATTPVVNGCGVSWIREDLGLIRSYSFRSMVTYALFPTTHQDIWAYGGLGQASGCEVIWNATWAPPTSSVSTGYIGIGVVR